MKVGDTLYRFDINRRRYDTDRRIIFAEHFEPVTITGEAKQSWLVGDWHPAKVNKRTLREARKGGWGGSQYYTAEGMADRIWDQEHRYRIREAVGRAPVSTLRRIAELLGDDAALTPITQSATQEGR